MAMPVFYRFTFRSSEALHVLTELLPAEFSRMDSTLPDVAELIQTNGAAGLTLAPSKAIESVQPVTQ